MLIVASLTHKKTAEAHRSATVFWHLLTTNCRQQFQDVSKYFEAPVGVWVSICPTYYIPMSFILWHVTSFPRSLAFSTIKALSRDIYSKHSQLHQLKTSKSTLNEWFVHFVSCFVSWMVYICSFQSWTSCSFLCVVHLNAKVEDTDSPASDWNVFSPLEGVLIYPGVAKLVFEQLLDIARCGDKNDQNMSNKSILYIIRTHMKIVAKGHPRLRKLCMKKHHT